MMLLARSLRWLQGNLVFTRRTMTRWGLACKLAIGRFLQLFLKFSQGTFLYLCLESQRVASYHFLLQDFLGCCFVDDDCTRLGIIGHRTWGGGQNCRFCGGWCLLAGFCRRYLRDRGRRCI